MTEYLREDLIECESIHGNQIRVPREALRFRVSVYAIVIDDSRLLIMNNKSTDKLAFPGGGIELGEYVEHALKREVREETGIEIKIERLLDFKEHFFYYDPKSQAFHSFMLYFFCHPLNTDLLMDIEVEDDESKMPRWMPLRDLEPDDFFGPNQEVFALLRKERAA